MDALNSLKFWKPSMASSTKEISDPFVLKEDEVDVEDSFFDLELFHSIAESKTHMDEQGEMFSKRKIIPIQSNSKIQSPISPTKTAPKLGNFMLKKSKLNEITEEIELNGAYSVPVFSRDKSLRSNVSKVQKQGTGNSVLGNPSSNRFSKDVIQKYLKLIKPLYVKASKKNGENVKLSVATPASLPATVNPVSKQGNILAGRRVKCKKLGKSKSASAAVGAASPARSKKDDSLLQQYDGIQSAILHCKRSFNSSRDSSMLSVSAHDPN